MLFPNEQTLALLPLFAFMLVVDLTLKGLALWRAAKNSQKYWFVALLLISSVGILPTLYILLFQSPKAKNK